MSPSEQLIAHAQRLGVLNIAHQALLLPGFTRWSGSSKPGQHHYGDGGLINHTAEVADLCLKARASFPQCQGRIDERELYLAALFHDVGKIWDYQWTEKEGWHGAPHKRLIHHISRSAIQWARAVDLFPAYRPIEEPVTHAILAHHGQRDWGSPVAPKSRVAWILHLCDAMSARMDDADTIDVIRAPQSFGSIRRGSAGLSYHLRDDCHSSRLQASLRRRIKRLDSHTPTPLLFPPIQPTMRFAHKPRPEENDTRIRHVFLLWPRFAKAEIRWLEWATIEEEYDEDDDYGDTGWHFVRFVDSL